jgi:hypothetical protein
VHFSGYQLEVAMKIKATRIIIRSAESSALWYSGAINEQFWAENVGGDFPWKVVQEGADLPTQLYVHKEDAEPLREAQISVELVQVIREC